MRIFHSEFGHNYQTYSFGYAVHAQLEPGDDPALAYQQGFLPYYSPELGVDNFFYQARSVRLPVADFSVSSENRRVLKKFDGHFAVRIQGAKEARTDSELRALILSYFKERHGNVMPQARLEGILETTLPLRVIRYERDGELIAAVLEVSLGSFSHFWYSAYDLSLVHQSLGMWLILDAVRRAKEEGRTHLYLGTMYGEKARYKMAVAPLEFWDGDGWNADQEELKRRILHDAPFETGFGHTFNKAI